jgi:hypothetical protein
MAARPSSGHDDGDGGDGQMAANWTTVLAHGRTHPTRFRSMAEPDFQADTGKLTFGVTNMSRGTVGRAILASIRGRISSLSRNAKI